MKNLAASVHARLAQHRAKTGEEYNVLLVRFTLERLLYRLSRSSHREHFCSESCIRRGGLIVRATPSDFLPRSAATDSRDEILEASPWRRRAGQGGGEGRGAHDLDAPDDAISLNKVSSPYPGTSRMARQLSKQ